VGQSDTGGQHQAVIKDGQRVVAATLATRHLSGCPLWVIQPQKMTVRDEVAFPKTGNRNPN
jgi:hypothetical protein